MLKSSVILLLLWTSETLVVGQELRRPLSELEIAHLLTNHVPVSHVAEIAHQYGIGFPVDKEAETRLAQVGATQDLLKTLAVLTVQDGRSEVAVAGLEPQGPVLVVSSGTGGVEVYLDGRGLPRPDPYRQNEFGWSA
jgi:hypothetical protein